MSDLSRRELIGLLAATPLPGLLGLPAGAIERASRTARGAAGAEPRFFTAAEWRTVRVLADLVIPADDRSGSATEAGVPEFIDFIMAEYPDQQARMRGGLAWLDAHSRRRFGRPFADGSPAQQTGVLDEVAWPDRAEPAVSQGVAFFNRFRDLVAAGFFSSRIGVEDLRYRGNTFVTEWAGCPEPQLRKLGVRYEE